MDNPIPRLIFSILVHLCRLGSGEGSVRVMLTPGYVQADSVLYHEGAGRVVAVCRDVIKDTCSLVTCYLDTCFSSEQEEVPVSGDFI